jgi:hypothetical protein
MIHLININSLRNLSKASIINFVCFAAAFDALGNLLKSNNLFNVEEAKV